ncbi:DUF4238 domain-containing protein [Streptomyces jumonjinensis]|uniref:DUF4238 domain-containing protein n=1 Tax=Streptomyces jumonjinensis TaxID=1945 RepID=A0A646KLE9_STRJU|nr:DUF4238 domain-containing protein [Streptomyces jumonjinensis]MQT03063.1 DUF4238 domain-containing protein [Streptomyces jumonjinensis]
MKAAHISRQHLVSQVLIKQFAMPGPKASGEQVLPFDVWNPERQQKLKGPRACGAAKDFVAFDSPSAEALWGSVEARVPSALAAVKAGTPFADPRHVEVLRDLVVLHYVRSHRYRSVYTKAFETVSVDVRGKLVRLFPEQLRREALRQTGLHLPGSGSLGAFAERLVEQSEVTQRFESGELFRTSIENMFNKVRAKAAKWHLEVLTPESRQFLIGDNPAVSVRTDIRPFSHGMAFGDAHSIVLPVGPRRLLALAPENMMGSVPRAVVDELNAVQILAADRYVYMHPQSQLETFARTAAKRRQVARSHH